ncbi:2-amino-4-hydroxy-6-hydroxymethyldihydropteridine diphosphokinase [Marivita geojedonensis]|uniref:2-amino-4-hydroxy-6-hydroxymethyldihydropteridine pyrophosphokinase n=1 Tax=Marivita geojedonensis TaxID=1123756 RepID=A0A1X4NQD4_9RHOB|nr:2-amino-4-hydroxy-6-hydroxymethyldihydropteridine diphosphokinase [Marivita geojedonensis]OSQ53174.1 2-amino-4-hydroxy-6-hydroxymethyldihydropteridine pyrophosphokinase [Marivita geojedonensis]PRY81887.1 2-amino-4-hydroxy-6-hydroxymethyldihydropteridine diphosphokinase [Marivita geojedonensis]
MNDFYIALGANLPSGERSPTDTLLAALDELGRTGVVDLIVSPFYSTPCFPPGAGPDYVNAAARFKSRLTPDAMLARLHEIEAQFGRERHVRWGMRTLDLDLIACDGMVLPNLETYARWRDLPQKTQKSQAPETLILPHPRMQDRAFVLVPMRDIAPDWRHPVLDLTVDEMCNRLSPEALAEIVVLEI